MQIVHLKLREPDPKDTKQRKSNIVHENKVEGQ